MKLNILLRPHQVRWLCAGLVICTYYCSSSNINLPARAVSNSANSKQNFQEECGAGTLVAFSRDNRSSLGICPLKHTDVNAKVSGFAARVTVRQQFHNPYQHNIEAVYTFPLPENAAVDQMLMKIGTRIIKGSVQKREEARRIYEKAKSEGHLSSLLDQERPNIFTQAVANIQPGESVDIEISYIELLKYEKGEFTFTFPTVVGPRFIPGERIAHEAGRRNGTVPDTNQVPDASRITPPIAKPELRSGHDISIAVNINAGLVLSKIHSALHELDIKQESPDRARVMLGAKDRIPNRDFVLSWSVVSDKIASGYVCHNENRDGFISFMMIPPRQVLPESISPKEMIFLIDCSGSQTGEPIRKAKQTIAYILSHMNPNDSFRILAFNNGVTEFSKNAERNSASAKKQALEFLRGLNAQGGTWMAPAVEKVCALPRQEHQMRVVVFMTDGFVGNDFEILSLVKKYRSDTRWFPFGTGNSVNRFLIDQIASEGGGEPEYVLLNSSASEVGKKFYDRISTPILTDIKIETRGIEVNEIFPKGPSDLWAQRPLFFTGRYKSAGKGKFILSAFCAGKPYKQEMDFIAPENETANVSLPSVWARMKINNLMSQDWNGLQHGLPEGDPIRAEIETTALKYHVMSQYTSFVAVDQSINNEGKTVPVAIPVELPDGVSPNMATSPSAGSTIASTGTSGMLSNFATITTGSAGSSGNITLNASPPAGTLTLTSGFEQPTGPRLFLRKLANAFSANNLSGEFMLDNSRLKKETESNTNAYYISGGACQPFFLEDDPHTLMVGEKGTAFKADGRTVNLQQGKICAMVHKKPLRVLTPSGQIELTAESDSIVQVASTGLTRLANLHSKENCKISWTHKGVMHRFDLAPGEEICLSVTEAETEQILPVDGVSRTEIKSEIVDGITVVRCKFNKVEMVQKEKLLVCNAGSFYQARREINRLKDLILKESESEAK